MAFKIIVNLIVNAAYIFIPSLICYKILKSEMYTATFVDLCFVYLLLLAAMIILSYFLIEFTANNFIRFIVIILAASGVFFCVLSLGPKDACNGSLKIVLSIPLLLIYFICFLIVFALYIRKKYKPVNK
jgi:hypothetical protein